MDEFKSSFNISSYGHTPNSPILPAKPPTSKKLTGCLLMVISFLAMFIIPIIWGFSSYVLFAPTGSSNPSDSFVTFMLFYNVIFGFLGLAAIAGFFVGLVFLILGFFKK